MSDSKPIPPDAVRREYSEFLRQQGIDPETVAFEVSHAKHIATFNGEIKTITTTVLELSDGSRYEWFPEMPDWQKRQRSDES